MAGRKGQNSDKGQRGGCCCSHREMVWGPGTARVNSRLTYAQETEDHTAELPEAHGGSGSGGCSGCVCGVGVGGGWALASSALVGGFVCDVSVPVSFPSA